MLSDAITFICCSSLVFWDQVPNFFFVFVRLVGMLNWLLRVNGQPPPHQTTDSAQRKAEDSKAAYGAGRLGREPGGSKKEVLGRT